VGVLQTKYHDFQIPLTSTYITILNLEVLFLFPKFNHDMTSAVITSNYDKSLDASNEEVTRRQVKQNRFNKTSEYSLAEKGLLNHFT